MGPIWALSSSMVPQLTKLYNGGSECNTYVYGEEGKPCLVFDFGDNANHKIESFCARHYAYIAGIFLTHGHVDHIQGLKNVEAKPSLRIILHQDDRECLDDPKLNASASLFGEPFSLERELPFYFAEDGDEIFLGAAKVKGPDGIDMTLGGYTVEIIHTPFHTAGSVVYYLKDEGILFSGDTLFKGGIGRYDLPGAKPRLMRESLAKLMRLPPETKVYPGHGPSTTIGEELRYNPYLRGIE